MSSTGKDDVKIAIVGGGIGGFGVALALQKRGFQNVHVFEADPSFHARRQGYGFTIQQGSKAIEALDILQDIIRIDTESDSHYMLRSDGSILGFFGRAFYDTTSNTKIKTKKRRYNLHLPRQKLREFLMEKLKANTILWAHRLRSIVAQSSDLVTLTFTNGLSYDANIVIGADGIYSKTRSMIIQEIENPLEYLGVIVILGITSMQHPFLQRRVFQTMNGDARLFAMPFTTTETMWQLSFPYPENLAKEICSREQLPALRAEVMRRCEAWHDPVPEMLKRTPDDLWMATPVYDRDPLASKPLSTKDDGPFGGRWPVTLLGDAGHPMSPFKGQGANQALLDACLLAEMLDEHLSKLQHGKDAVASALDAFEVRMLERSHSKVLGSREAVYRNHQANAFTAISDGRGMHAEFIDFLASQDIRVMYPYSDRMDQVINDAKIQFSLNKGNS